MAKKILGFLGFLMDDNRMATAVRQGDMRTFWRVEEATACEATVSPAPPPGREQAPPHRRQVSDPFVIATGYPTAPRPPRAGASHSPYSVRLPPYRVGAIPCGRPGGGGRPISTILILTPMGRGLPSPCLPDGVCVAKKGQGERISSAKRCAPRILSAAPFCQICPRLSWEWLPQRR